MDSCFLVGEVGIWDLRLLGDGGRDCGVMLRQTLIAGDRNTEVRKRAESLYFDFHI